MSVYDRDDPTHLRMALESIWSHQCLKPYEIVLVEDGPLNLSLDSEINDFRNKTGAIIKSVKLSENKGLTYALNRGIAECSGELIARMDSDDISVPSRFKIQHDFFVKNPSTDVLGGAIQEFDDDNDCRFIRYYPDDTQKAKRLIATASPFAHPTVMFNRRVFDQGFTYNEKFRTSQDIELWFRLLLGGFEFANISTPLVYYRMNEGFEQRRSVQKAINEFIIYWRGINNVFGWNWRLIFPVFRLGFRIAPKNVLKKIYRSRLRKVLNSN